VLSPPSAGRRRGRLQPDRHSLQRTHPGHGPDRRPAGGEGTRCQVTLPELPARSCNRCWPSSARLLGQEPETGHPRRDLEKFLPRVVERPARASSHLRRRRDGGRCTVPVHPAGRRRMTRKPMNKTLAIALIAVRNAVAPGGHRVVRPPPHGDHRLPLTVKGDGTIAGLVAGPRPLHARVAGHHPLAQTIWIGSAAVSAEIQDRQIHLVVTNRSAAPRSGWANGRRS